MTGFGLRLKELRIERGIRQNDLSEKMGVPRYCVANWEQERSEPSLEDLIELASALSVSIGYLLGAEGDDGQVVPKDLTEDEKKLLSDYRKLNGYQKETVLTQISAIAQK